MARLRGGAHTAARTRRGANPAVLTPRREPGAGGCDIAGDSAPAPVLATVRLVNAVFYAHHGVMEEEHVIGGRFEVDVAMTLDVAEAAETDSLDRTVDYERVYRIAREVVTGANAFLIERLAWGIAGAVREAYPTLERVEVTVRKPNPPVGGPCDRAEVTLALGPA